MYEVNFKIYGVEVVTYVPNLVAMDAIIDDANTKMLSYRWIEPDEFIEKKGR